MSVVTSERAGPIDRTVLLFSGGMDSVCMAHLLRPDVLLYAPSGSAYQKREQLCVEQLCAAAPGMAEQLQEVNVVDLGRWERDDFIVPNRNAHLLLLASLYGDTIWLGSVQGDRSCDKDVGFFAIMQQLLDHMWQEQHWTQARQFSVSAPYKSTTKTQMVNDYLSEGGRPDLLLVSFSCYEGGLAHCGQCKPCFRKWVALNNNGVAQPVAYWVRPPNESPWLQRALPAMRAGQHRGAEDAEALRALSRVNHGE